MSQGVSHGELAAVSSRVSAVESQVAAAQRAIAELEREMGQIANAVDRVNDSIRALHQTTAEGMHTLAAQVGEVDKSVHLVDRGVQRMSASIAHTEILKAVSDMGGGSVQIAGVKSDAQEHFEKALNRIAGAEAKYDSIDARVLDAHQREIQRCGEQIFELWDRDFRRPVRSRLVNQARKHLRSARDFLRQLCRRRGEALDGRMAPVVREAAEFSERRHRFEQDLRRYLCDGVQEPADLAIEALLLEREGGGPEALVGRQIERTGGQPADRLRYRLAGSSYFSDLGRVLQGAVSASSVHTEWSVMNGPELEAVCGEFRAMAADGLISPEYAAELVEHFQRHPPAMLRRAELLGRLTAAPAGGTNHE